ncbi:hypothetical protein Avbf_02750 [Armadillidium vulgare]|nr:hypothetical protein Avbf_02750 [Armadillidium vulgare]
MLLTFEKELSDIACTAANGRPVTDISFEISVLSQNVMFKFTISHLRYYSMLTILPSHAAFRNIMIGYARKLHIFIYHILTSIISDMF